MTSTPVVLVHGWGGSFSRDLGAVGLHDAPRRRRPTGHRRRPVGATGTAPKPHDPEAYADLAARVFDAIDEQAGPDAVVDAVGFSLGAMTLMGAAIARPERFGRLVLAGVGQNVFERDEAATAAIVAAIEGDSDTHDNDASNRARLFAQYAHQSGNDPGGARRHHETTEDGDAHTR